MKEGDRLAEWDPFTLPIITEQSGVVRYQDLVEGKTLEERVDEATGIAQRVVTEYRAAGRSKKEDLRPRLTLLSEDDARPRAKKRKPAALHAGSGHHPFGRGRPGGRSRRHSRPCHRAKPPRRATSPAVCRVLPSCSRRACRRTTRSSPRFQRPDRIRSRLQGQAQDRDRSGRGRSGRVPDPQDQGDRRAGRRLRQEGRHADFRLAQPARHPRSDGRRGAGRISRHRDPGSLSPAGREDQRQAHRGDRSPDAAEGRDHRWRRHHAAAGRTGRPGGDERGQRQADQEQEAGAKASRSCSASPRRACRPAASSRRPRSRKPPAC